MGPNHAAVEQGQEYATPADFQRIFHDEVDSLYTLALLLTADHSRAEQCFVIGLSDCVDGNPTFVEWAQSWARRVIIKNAIRMLSPRPGENPVVTRLNDCQAPAPVSDAALLGDIARLPSFERFVYVMSVLEGYCARDCSILLRCTDGEIVEARTRALKHLACTRQEG